MKILTTQRSNSLKYKIIYLSTFENLLSDYLHFRLLPLWKKLDPDWTRLKKMLMCISQHQEQEASREVQVSAKELFQDQCQIHNLQLLGKYLLYFWTMKHLPLMTLLKLILSLILKLTLNWRML